MLVPIYFKICSEYVKNLKSAEGMHNKNKVERGSV